LPDVLVYPVDTNFVFLNIEYWILNSKGTKCREAEISVLNVINIHSDLTHVRGI
jgi:hypothetical protein